MTHFKARINKQFATSSIALLASTTHTVSAAPVTLWQQTDAAQPESVVAHQSVLYVSNINGNPIELNGLGYISKLDPSGEVIEQKWATGLDAPKGMAVSGKYLYVADMQRLVKIALATGEIVENIKLDNAKMLNDITVSDKGEILVSDLLAGGVYTLQGSQLVSYLQTDAIPHPNGLLWHNNSLLIGSWGAPLNNDFTTGSPGSLYQYKPAEQTLTVIEGGKDIGNIDGIVAYQNKLYISDWISGALYKIENGQRSKIKQMAQGLADIGIDPNGTIYAPMMMTNTIDALQDK